MFETSALIYRFNILNCLFYSITFYFIKKIKRQYSSFNYIAKKSHAIDHDFMIMDPTRILSVKHRYNLKSICQDRKIKQKKIVLSANNHKCQELHLSFTRISDDILLLFPLTMRVDAKRVGNGSACDIIIPTECKPLWHFIIVRFFLTAKL